MYYEINVCLNGKHLFATAERSITGRWELEKVYNIFKEKFPKEEGYELNVIMYSKVGEYINME